MKRLIWQPIALLILALLGSAAVANASVTVHTTASQGRSHATIYRDAQHVLSDTKTRTPWDGRYAYTKRHGMCVETFNGTRHDITTYGHGLPPGFYLKVCADGNYYVNDGVHFPGMRAY